MADRRPPRPPQEHRPKPLDQRLLGELALTYVARFSTSKAKLERYLKRKLYERGWEGEEPADTAALAERFAELGYLDDAAYAQARASSLLARGYGARRVNEALGEAGIAEDIRRASAPGQHAARRAALKLAERRRLGPFGRELPEREAREKQLAAMLRAGHPLDMARYLVNAHDADEARAWAAETDGEDDDPDC
jgi:regulatory protein